MVEWHIEADRMSADGKTIRQISEELGVTYNAVKKHLQYMKKNKGIPQSISLSKSKGNKTTYSNGGYIFEDEQQVINGQEITPELIMKAKGLKVEEWEVVSFTKNVWQQQTKDGNTIDLCQSKLTVKPKAQNKITFADIDEYFSRTEKTEFDIKPIKYDVSGEVLTIDCADIHNGLLSYRKEVGTDFDLKICAERFLSAIDDIVGRAKGRKWKKVYLCTLGDVIHIDNDKNETTKGTIQQADGRITKIFDCAVDMMQKAVEMLLELDAKVEYVYLCGNHDRNTGYFLVKCLERTFSNNPNVMFDTEPNPQKAIHFGNVLIGLTHGDMPKYNKGTWLINDYRKWFGESKFVEEHCGHIHTEEARMYNGIMVRSVMAQCGNSYWEHQQGYRSERGLMSFVWNENSGLRETWYYYF